MTDVMGPNDTLGNGGTRFGFWENYADVGLILSSALQYERFCSSGDDELLTYAHVVRNFPPFQRHSTPFKKNGLRVILIAENP
jgi:hypothetical protein